MGRVDNLHWQAEAGDNWATVAAATGTTRNALLTCNGEPTNNPPALKAGRIVHVPFLVVP